MDQPTPDHDTVSFGYEDIAADEKAARVGAVFSNVASKYDIMNDAMLAERGAEVTVADINQDMLDVGIERAMERGITGLSWSCQNAEELSYPARQFDAYTIAFGIRNVTRIDKALREAHRVLKFGGRFFCLEFSTVEWPGFREAYDLYSHKLVPQIGKMVAGDEDSYRYLIESIRRFPPMPEFERMIRDAGFENTRVEPIMGGLVAIHSGWKV